MPYFVYRVETQETGKKDLTYLEDFVDYKSARALTRTKRAEAKTAETADYRLIFAKNETEAEKLLSAPRDERVVGED